jgi:importin-4
LNVSADTDKVKAVTSELQKSYLSQPDSLLLLIEIAFSEPDAGIRQLAAVQAVRVVPKYWAAVPVEKKAPIKKHVLDGTLAESITSTRHSQSRLLAILVGLDLQTSDGQQLVDSIFKRATEGGNAVEREVSLYIIYSMLEEDPTQFQDHVAPLLQLFSRSIKDSESKDVQVTTIKAIGAILMVVDADEDEDSVQAVQNLFPDMVRVLSDAINAGDADQYRDIFEVLQSFLAYDSALLSKHLKDLIKFMIGMAANKDTEEEARSQALTFLSQCVRYRRMKIQGMKDVGAMLMQKSMEIVTEIDDDADEDDTSPARTALALIDQLANDLPPRQVVNPLLDDFPKYATNPDPGYRKSAILSLGMAVEGAPEFIATQLKSVLPLIMGLLNDPDDTVRHAALVGLIHIADDMSDELSSTHVELIDALLKNLQAAGGAAPDKKNIGILRAVCGALESLGDSFAAEVTREHGRKLIAPLGTLLSHDDIGVKSAAAGAIGSIALAMGDEFKQFFPEVMSAFAPYVGIKDSEDALSLRSSVCDSMGRIATAVGAEEFQPYVIDLMHASEEGLTLDNTRVKETSFILWASLAKVYGENFADFLPGVFKGLLETLELEEEEISLDGFADNDQDGEVLVVGGKKLKLKKVSEDDAIDMDEDGEWGDIDEFTGATAVALEQEIAIEVLGDVITHACDLQAIKTYLEPTVTKLVPLADHSYEGCRKAVIATLWRAYARVWQLFEQHTGQKWQAGTPKDRPITEPVLANLAELLATATMPIWANDAERFVPTFTFNSRLPFVFFVMIHGIPAHADAIRRW